MKWREWQRFSIRRMYGIIFSSVRVILNPWTIQLIQANVSHSQQSLESSYLKIWSKETYISVWKHRWIRTSHEFRLPHSPLWHLQPLNFNSSMKLIFLALYLLSMYNFECINPLKTKRRLLYLKTQFVPRRLLYLKTQFVPRGPLYLKTHFVPRRPLYLKTQFVPRSKHFSPRL